jgi:coenzyme PQQ biosynthesis protein PqqD
MPMTSASRPRLWRLARVDFDRVRQRPVLLYPEGAIFINDTGRAILELCNGHRTTEEIARLLGERYGADASADVAEFLNRLEARELVTDASAPPPGTPGVQRGSNPT